MRRQEHIQAALVREEFGTRQAHQLSLDVHVKSEKKIPRIGSGAEHHAEGASGAVTAQVLNITQLVKGVTVRGVRIEGENPRHHKTYDGIHFVEEVNRHLSYKLLSLLDT